MVWLKIDDRFHQHAKVLRIPKEQRLQAVGLWTVCGTWVASSRTDGMVPAEVVESFDGPPEIVAALVAVRLWKRVRGGFAFVNWDEFQPTRSQLDERTRLERERKRAQREQGKKRSPDEAGGSVRGTTVVSHGSASTPSRPDPTRPDSLRSSVSAPGDNPGENDGRTDDESHDGGESARWAGYLGVDLERVRKELAKRLGRIVPGPVALRIVSEVLDRAPRKPDKPTGYVLTSIATDWPEWERFVLREEEAGAA